MEFKSIRVLDSTESKGVAEREIELVEKHEKSLEESQASVVEDTPSPEPTPEPAEDLDEQKVLSYIGKRYNKQINSIDDLVAERQEAEPLPEDVSAFLKYKKETGRGIEDFMKLNQDYDQVDDAKIIKDYLKATREGLDEDDISTLMEEYEYDEEFDEESRIKKVKIERKEIINDAKKFFKSQQEKYKAPLESRPVAMSSEEKAEYESYREYTKQAKTYEEEAKRKANWFNQKTEELFSGEFKGFEFNVNDKKITFSPGDAAELKRLQSNPQNFITRFLDEQGLIKDAAGYHKSLAIAMNPEKFAKFFYEQGQADGIGNLDKKMKNVSMSVQRAPEPTKTTEGVQVRVVNPDSGRSLKIRSAKKL
jgi:hypothetical protein